MAWSVTVGAVVSGDGNAPTTAAPSGVTAGDLLVLVLTSELAIQQSTPSGWALRQHVNTQSAVTEVAVYDRIADGTAADAPTISSSTSQSWQTVMLRITGHDPVNYYDTSGATGSGDGTNAGTIDTPALTIANDDSLLIAAGVLRNDAISVTFPGGWTEDADAGSPASARPHRLYAGHREVDSGSYAAETITLSGSDDRRCLAAVAYKPAAGGTTPQGSANLSGIASLTATGSRPSEASSDLSGIADLSATGARNSETSVDLTAVLGLTATGARASVAVADLSAVATITIIGSRPSVGIADLTGVASLEAVGETPTVQNDGFAVLTAVADITATGARASEGEADITGVLTITVTSYRPSTGSVTLTSVSSLEASGARASEGATSLSAVAGMTAQGVAEAFPHGPVSATTGIEVLVTATAGIEVLVTATAGIEV